MVGTYPNPQWLDGDRLQEVLQAMTLHEDSTRYAFEENSESQGAKSTLSPHKCHPGILALLEDPNRAWIGQFNTNL